MAANKGGRPKKRINFETVDKLCGLHCTGEEIAAFLGIDYDTLNARIKEKYDVGFSEYYKKKKGFGKVSLRRMQWEAAQQGNITMLIWLGKQYLGQKDKQEIAHSGGLELTEKFKHLSDEELKEEMQRLDALDDDE